MFETNLDYRVSFRVPLAAMENASGTKALPRQSSCFAFLPTAPGAYQGEKLRERSKQEGEVMGEREREWKVNNLRLS